MVKRYNPYSAIDLSVWIVEDPQGQLIMSADYDALAAKLETERMRLAGCGVAALADTPDSMKSQRLDPESPYWSASYGDVLRRVQECIDLRARIRDLEARWEGYMTLAPDNGVERIAALEAALRECTEKGANIAVIVRDALTPAKTPAKYGSCPECSGKGGAHFTSCSHSPTKIKGDEK